MANTKNPNHPHKGMVITDEPIRSKEAIASIKKLLADHPHDLCLFALGINTALQSNVLLSLNVDEVEQLQIGDLIELKQSKIGQYRTVSLTRPGFNAIQSWLKVYPLERKEGQALFITRDGNRLNEPTVSSMVKDWCRRVHLSGNYGSDSLCKTWGFHQRLLLGTSMRLRTEGLGPANQKQALDFFDVLSNEVMHSYQKLEL